MIRNIEKINVKKRDKVKLGAEYIERINDEEPIIDRMIIFGSAVTDDCTDESDIDVCLVSEFACTKQRFLQVYGNMEIVMDDLCDIVVYNNVKGKLKEEIDAKGIVVYEREAVGT